MWLCLEGKTSPPTCPFHEALAEPVVPLERRASFTHLSASALSQGYNKISSFIKNIIKYLHLFYRAYNSDSSAVGRWGVRGWLARNCHEPTSSGTSDTGKPEKAPWCPCVLRVTWHLEGACAGCPLVYLQSCKVIVLPSWNLGVYHIFKKKKIYLFIFGCSGS